MRENVLKCHSAFEKDVGFMQQSGPYSSPWVIRVDRQLGAEEMWHSNPTFAGRGRAKVRTVRFHMKSSSSSSDGCFSQETNRQRTRFGRTMKDVRAIEGEGGRKERREERTVDRTSRPERWVGGWMDEWMGRAMDTSGRYLNRGGRCVRYAFTHPVLLTLVTRNFCQQELLLLPQIRILWRLDSDQELN